jgi:hypothetical protein
MALPRRSNGAISPASLWKCTTTAPTEEDEEALDDAAGSKIACIAPDNSLVLDSAKESWRSSTKGPTRLPTMAADREGLNTEAFKGDFDESKFGVAS